MKRIFVASLNANKIQAVQEVFPSHEVKGVPGRSGVREQPLSPDEIIEGAIFRAKAAQANEFEVFVHIYSGYNFA